MELSFIARSGDRLMDGDREWRCIGANMPGLVLPYDFTLWIPERMELPTPWEQEDGFRTLAQMGAQCVRTWNLPLSAPDTPDDKRWEHVTRPGEFNEAAFRVIDHAIALAGKYGVRMIIPLTAEAGDYLGGIGTYAAYRGKKRAEFYTDPDVREDYKATVRYVLTRRNTVTGVLYRDDPAILCWEFGNEMWSAPEEWQSDIAAFMKSLDPNHLVMTGRDDRIPDEVDPNIDIYTRHYYGGDWLAQVGSDRDKLRGKRPFLVGEYGLSTDVEMVDKFLNAAIDNGTTGALIWSMYFHHRDGGFYWHQIFTHPSLWSYHWPGFPSGEAQRERELLAVLRAAAHRIDGRELPPMPAPAAPELLPIGGIPLISWRGSTGASGYDIERSATPEGQWTRIAGNVSDSDSAYRPLYSDTDTRAGDTWHYRVVARGPGGISPASNVVGPVTVRGIRVVDELRDLSRAASHSPGLTIVNDYNGHYGEHLYRARGGAGDWLLYHVPAGISRAWLSAWRASGSGELTLSASADGTSFAPVDAPGEITDFGGREGQKGRTRMEYAAPLPAGTRYLRVAWTGDAELDRVEMDSAGPHTPSPPSPLPQTGEG